jgi:FKBP-type peptidyl-prolyl cis-trans isomerase FklB
MKKIVHLFFLLTVITLPLIGQKKSVPKKKISNPVSTINQTNVNMNEQDTLLYCIASLVAEDYVKSFKSFNAEILTKAFSDAMAGNPAIPSDKARRIFSEFKTKALKADGENFLAANAKLPGVISLPNGLQYQILKEGDGPKPTAADQVTTHYAGTLINGFEFDSSVKRGQPATFPVGGVIKGWQEILQMMPKGSKWKVFIPYNLAYGERGAGGSIPPYSALIFEIELLEIVGK